MHPLPTSKILRSPGGSFVHVVQGPCCRLYDKEELPWPSCSLQWKGKQPSWNRVGPRFVPDMAAAKCPSYAVESYDHHGNCWLDVITLYTEPMPVYTRKWWVWKGPTSASPPATPDQMEQRLTEGLRW